MPTLGTTELIIILVIVLILFGGSRLGQLGGSLGRGIREFRESVRDEEAAGKDKDAKPGDGKGADAKSAAAGATATVAGTATKADSGPKAATSNDGVASSPSAESASADK